MPDKLSRVTPSTRSTVSGASARVSPRRAGFGERVAELSIRAIGMTIFVVVALMLVFLGREALPLFQGASQSVISEMKLLDQPHGNRVLVLGMDEHNTHAYYLDGDDGTLRFADAHTGSRRAEFHLRGLESDRATAAYRTPVGDKLLIGTSSGRLLLAEAEFEVTHSEKGGRSINPGHEDMGTIAALEAGPITHVHLRQDSAGDFFYAAANSKGRVFAGRFVVGETGDPPQFVGETFPGRITALAVDHEGDKLFVATDKGKLHHYQLAENGEAPYRTYDLHSTITALDYVIGDVSLLIGFADGSVESWFGVRESESDALKPFRRIHSFSPMPAAVTFIQPSARDKGFLVGAADGTVKLNFTTSERTLLTSKLAAPVARLAYGPKLTAMLALGEDGKLRHTAIDNPHPQVSLRTLFGRVHYEGYDKPDYIWQSTGGTDDFESKFSLVPLCVGTLKGAFYGLVFAVPVAVFAALYTSQFVAPRMKAWLKPAVETMAALPSVVIGMIAGLWLAPLLEGLLVGTMLAVFIVPLTVIVGAVGWAFLPPRIRARVPAGREMLLLLPLVALGFWISQALGPTLEGACFGGDYQRWVFEVFGHPVEQRNSIVISIAMGIAVIPVIFTISEDAFSNVPKSYRSASLALGASSWQTAMRVILPSASPGVFSAVMIGCGRAIGETMIVLMATGNTPIMDFSPFNGMRTLAANTAVEIPEAPVGGTLYRVLFVGALLLFGLTFLCNTAAEAVRHRLRQRYQTALTS